jgi:hypothetical protein
MTGGSLQLRLFRKAIAAGASCEDAAEQAGISIEEAKLILSADAADPPPPEAFQLIGESKEYIMARRPAAKPKEEFVGEVKPMDFDRAVRLYKGDIKPAISKVGEHNQAAGTAYKEIKKACRIQPAAAKLAFKLSETEEAKRDDFLRGLGGLLKAMGVDIVPTDLIDLMSTETKDNYARPKPVLVTVSGPPDDSDLSGDADEPSAVDKARSASDDDDEFYDSAKGETVQ